MKIHGTPQARRICFTLNNPTQDDLERARATVGDDTLHGGICGFEVGESGTPHLQGYLEFSRRMRFGGVRSRLPWLGRAALFAAKGSRQCNREYCSKDEDIIFDFGLAGSNSGQSSRSDLHQIREQIDNGVPELEIAEQHFSRWVQYRRAFSAYRQLRHGNDRELRLDLRVKLLWGRAGTGKSRSVYEEEKDLWSWPGGAWFDGYSGQQAVLFDDFCGELPLVFFLRVLDIYPIDVPVKGSFVPWRPRRIYITSNKPLSEWYPWVGLDDPQLPALTRRIHETIHFN